LQARSFGVAARAACATLDREPSPEPAQGLERKCLATRDECCEDDPARGRELLTLNTRRLTLDARKAAAPAFRVNRFPRTQAARVPRASRGGAPFAGNRRGAVQASASTRGEVADRRECGFRQDCLPSKATVSAARREKGRSRDEEVTALCAGRPGADHMPPLGRASPSRFFPYPTFAVPCCRPPSRAGPEKAPDAIQVVTRLR
jgi:hypothetical protein